MDAAQPQHSLTRSHTIKAESVAAHKLLLSHEIWDVASHIGSDIYQGMKYP